MVLQLKHLLKPVKPCFHLLRLSLCSCANQQIAKSVATVTCKLNTCFVKCYLLTLCECHFSVSVISVNIVSRDSFHELETLLSGIGIGRKIIPFSKSIFLDREKGWADLTAKELVAVVVIILSFQHVHHYNHPMTFHTSLESWNSSPAK